MRWCLLIACAAQGCDFQGGTFCFQAGAVPLRVEPAAGMLLIYTADDSNVHSVEEVTSGERSTLAMWFTMDPEHQEDKKVCGRCGVRWWQKVVSSPHMSAHDTVFRAQGSRSEGGGGMLRFCATRGCCLGATSPHVSRLCVCVCVEFSSAIASCTICEHVCVCVLT